jgi:hypothetical protein
LSATKPRSVAKCKHTPCPTGYVAWHEWALKKMTTHRTTRCPSCRLWLVWVPKKRRKQPLSRTERASKHAADAATKERTKP